MRLVSFHVVIMMIIMVSSADALRLATRVAIALRCHDGVTAPSWRGGAYVFGHVMYCNN